jgi:anti-anti-sigma regulatory factor/GAF domain-containing protein
MATKDELQARITELETALAKATVIEQISRDLNTASDEDELLQVLARPAIEAGAFSTTLLYIDLDEAGEPEWLEMVASGQPESAPTTSTMPVGTRFYLPEFLFSRLWMASPDEPQLIADVKSDERADEVFRNVLTQSGIQATAVIPLTQAGRWVGLIVFSWAEPHQFSALEVEIYRALADLASPAVENRRLLVQTQKALAETETFYGISRDLNTASDENELLQILTRPGLEAGVFMTTLMYFDLDAAGEPEWGEVVATWQREGEPGIPVGTRFYLPEFPFSRLWMASQDEPQLIADTATDERVDENTRQALVQAGTRALAVIPLSQAGRWVGLLNLSWTESHEFSVQEVATYRALMSLASPAVGSRRLLVEKQAERVRLQQEVIEAQQRAIKELSTPVIPVMDRIIVMPLIGSIDTMRAKDITRALLAGIREHRARVVILDITGVPIVDSGVADHLNKTIQAARLKGARAIVTGMSDAVAETIVDLGIDWSGIDTLSDSQTGLVAALDSLGFTLARRST